MNPIRPWAYRALSIVATVVWFCLTACEPKTTEVDFRIRVKDNQGAAVANAVVNLGNDTKGRTDDEGLFRTLVSLEPGSQVTVKVTKESDRFYYAPHFDSFKVADPEKQAVSLEALLYFVPKPSPDDAKIVAEQDQAPAAATEPALESDPTDEAKIVSGDTLTVIEEDLAGPAPVASADAASLDPVDPPAAVAEAKKPEASQPTANSIETVEANDAPLPADVTGGEPAAPTEETPVAEAEAPALPEPIQPAVVLNRVDIEAEAPTKLEYPKTIHANQGPTIFTIHTYSGKRPVAGVAIYLGEEQKGRLDEACTTNERGRCVVRFKEKPVGTVTFVAKKEGFQTLSLNSRVTAKGKLRFNLVAGETIDIFALSRTYNYTRGLSDIEVYAQGRLVGTTDKFGRLSYFYPGKKGDLLEVTLKARDYLPEDYATDFVVAGPMNLVRYFSPQIPPPAKVAMLRVQPAGELGDLDAKAFNGTVDSHLRRAARSSLFSSGAFTEVPFTTFQKLAEPTGLTLAELVRSGWQKTDLKAGLDAVILPTLVVEEPMSLELSVVDSTGRVIAAAKERIEDAQDASAINHTLERIAQKITKAFPFEGAIVETNGNTATINLGYRAGRALSTGDVLDVYGVQSDKLGRKQEHKKIGIVKVKDVQDSKALVEVVKTEPRSVITRGDLVTMPLRKANEAESTQIQIVGVTGPKTDPIEQANVYFNEAWVGATDDQGRLYVDPRAASGTGLLRVIKHGFHDFTREFSFAGRKRIEIKLVRETAFVRVESEPAGATVRIDGKAIGKTPLASPVPVPSGFVKLEVDAPTGYKAFAAVLELDQGTLDLTGMRAIQLEKDLRATAHKLLDAGKVDAAADVLTAVPATHSDYLLCQHEAGEIYLTMLDNPAKAAEAFGKVTANPAVKSFNDKRFIGSHINEGIALYMTGERLQATEPEAAQAHYQKAIEVLEAVAPQLRFVPEDQYAQAIHNVGYHKALSQHKLWVMTQNPGLLDLAFRSWRDYLEGSAKATPLPADKGNYRESAEVYFKQVEATMAAAHSATRKL